MPNTLTLLALRVVVIIGSLLDLLLVIVDDVHTDSLQLLIADKHGHIPRAQTYKVGHESGIEIIVNKVSVDKTHHVCIPIDRLFANTGAQA